MDVVDPSTGAHERALLAALGAPHEHAPIRGRDRQGRDPVGHRDGDSGVGEPEEPAREDEVIVGADGHEHIDGHVSSQAKGRRGRAPLLPVHRIGR